MTFGGARIGIERAAGAVVALRLFVRGWCRRDRALHRQRARRGGAGADTIGFNVMLATAGAMTIATGAGCARGLDGVLQRRRPDVRAFRVLG